MKTINAREPRTKLESRLSPGQQQLFPQPPGDAVALAQCTARNEYAPGGVVVSELLGLQKCKMIVPSPEAYALSERFPSRPGGVMLVI